MDILYEKDFYKKFVYNIDLKSINLDIFKLCTPHRSEKSELLSQVIIVTMFKIWSDNYMC